MSHPFDSSHRLERIRHEVMSTPWKRQAMVHEHHARRQGRNDSIDTMTAELNTYRHLHAAE